MLCIFVFQKCMIVFVEKCMNTFLFLRAYIMHKMCINFMHTCIVD
jgi:hypothetical protein